MTPALGRKIPTMNPTAREDAARLAVGTAVRSIVTIAASFEAFPDRPLTFVVASNALDLRVPGDSGHNKAATARLNARFGAAAQELSAALHRVLSGNRRFQLKFYFRATAKERIAVDMLFDDSGVEDVPMMPNEDSDDPRNVAFLATPIYPSDDTQMIALGRWLEQVSAATRYARAANTEGGAMEVGITCGHWSRQINLAHSIPISPVAARQEACIADGLREKLEILMVSASGDKLIGVFDL